MADAASVPSLEFIFAARVSVDHPLDLGDVGKGGRRIVPIGGGDFSGPNIRGKVLPGGADWQIIRTDGVAELEARYTLRTDDGALIYVRNLAYRHGPPDVIAALAAGRRSIRQVIISAARRFRDKRRPLCLDHQAHRGLQRRARASCRQAQVLSAAVTEIRDPDLNPDDELLPEPALDRNGQSRRRHHGDECPASCALHPGLSVGGHSAGARPRRRRWTRPAAGSHRQM